MRVLLAEPTRIGRAIVANMLAEEGYTLIPVDSAEVNRPEFAGGNFI